MNAGILSLHIESLGTQPRVSANLLNGSAGAVAVDRAAAEFRSGRAVHVVGAEKRWQLACVEALSPQLLARLQARGTQALYLTRYRAHSLGLAVSDIAVIPRQPWTVARLQRMAGLVPRQSTVDLGDVDVAAAPADIQAAFALAKRIRLVPALLGSSVGSKDPGAIEVAVADINRRTLHGGVDLIEVTRARVPIAGDEDCRIALFRDALGGVEHLAIILGAVKQLDPVPVRLHSSCLTGDLLGSLRCDCGEQLRSAMRSMANAGGGVLLYLSQEGRGIGLANKLRAYALQDDGLDTLDADRHLGFAEDERDFKCAAAMLSALGISRIELYTNNPSKLEALRGAGIQIVERKPLVASTNVHNARYMQTKRERAGHL